MSEIRRVARRERLSVGEWVRRALREARDRRPLSDPETRLKALRRSVRYSFPTADIEQMIRETERGYLE
jgi:hypothetical protein